MALDANLTWATCVATLQTNHYTNRPLISESLGSRSNLAGIAVNARTLGIILHLVCHVERIKFLVFLVITPYMGVPFDYMKQ